MPPTIRFDDSYKMKGVDSARRKRTVSATCGLKLNINVNANKLYVPKLTRYSRLCRRCVVVKTRATNDPESKFKGRLGFKIPSTKANRNGSSNQTSPAYLPSSLDEDVFLASRAGYINRERMTDDSWYVKDIVDDTKESFRAFSRTTFDFQRWAAHRSTHRYFRHMMGIPASRMIQSLAWPLMFIGGISTALATTYTLIEHEILPSDFLASSWIIMDSRDPLTLTSFALSLLLVFRTNASYGRWLTARTTWGTLVNRSRDLARQGLTWLPSDTSEGIAVRKLWCRWIRILPLCLKCHLREGEDVLAELGSLSSLTSDDVIQLQLARHRPLFAVQVLSEIVKYLARNGAKQGHPLTCAVGAMDMNISALEDCIGTCERLLRTPIPLSYTRHTSRFMIIWLSLLPFSLWESCRWGIVPLSMLVSFLLLGIEEIGVQIEEPFGILPLEDICATIHSDVDELEGGWSSLESPMDGNGVSVYASAEELLASTKAHALSEEE